MSRFKIQEVGTSLNEKEEKEEVVKLPDPSNNDFGKVGLDSKAEIINLPSAEEVKNLNAGVENEYDKYLKERETQNVDMEQEEIIQPQKHKLFGTIYERNLRPTYVNEKKSNTTTYIIGVGMVATLLSKFI